MPGSVAGRGSRAIARCTGSAIGPDRQAAARDRLAERASAGSLYAPYVVRSRARTATLGGGARARSGMRGSMNPVGPVRMGCRDGDVLGARKGILTSRHAQPTKLIGGSRLRTLPEFEGTSRTRRTPVPGLQRSAQPPTDPYRLALRRQASSGLSRDESNREHASQRRERDTSQGANSVARFPRFGPRNGAIEPITLNFLRTLCALGGATLPLTCTNAPIQTLKRNSTTSPSAIT